MAPGKHVVPPVKPNGGIRLPSGVLHVTSRSIGTGRLPHLTVGR
ncbi:hypothetical protein ACU635_51305 [[Actinomadura] parvosata]